MLPNDDHLESFSGASELKVQSAGEYEAGYRARLADASASWTATAYWQAGWQEADREIATSGKSPRVSAGEQSEETRPAEWSSFGTGEIARSYGLPFAQASNAIWKRSWIVRDIELGIGKRRSAG